MISGLESTFVDTVSFIYLVENHPEYYEKVSNYLLKETLTNEGTLFTSVISISEFSVKPLREGDRDLLTDFEKMLQSFQFRVMDINIAMAKRAGELRAKYPTLKTVDALQIACAIDCKVRRFLTNDFARQQVKELEFVLINDLN